jgi:hypothetical protein
MPFNRWECAWPRSWPYVLFKKHHTQLNDLYWSGVAASGQAKKLADAAQPADNISTVLHVPAAEARRFHFTVAEWTEEFSDFENWVRLSALMALTGYLETYVHSIVVLALTSNPGVLLSSPRAVDGIALVKRNALPDLSPHVTAITKGEWNARLRKYEQLFGPASANLQSTIPDLEQMQKLRNGVGHAFGRMIHDYRSPLLRTTIPLQRLSQERLQKWLGVVDTCVAEMELQLRGSHLGAIEALLAYHHWDKQFQMGHMNEDQAFRATFPDTQGNPPPAAYFRQVIAHYRGA